MVKIYFGERVLTIGTSPMQSAGRELIQLPSSMQTTGVLSAVYAGAPGTCFFLPASHPEQELAKLSHHFQTVEAAGGLVYTADRTILLIFRREKWDLPKGKRDEGESLEECALREVGEETGVTNLRPGAPLLTTYHTYEEKGKKILKPSHWFFMYAQEAFDLTPQEDEDIELCVWVPSEALPPYLDGAHPSIRDVLESGVRLLEEKGWPILS